MRVWSVRGGLDRTLSLPSDNVLNVPSRNVLLTRSAWRGEQARTTTNDTTRARPAGGAAQSRQKTHHAKAGRPADGPQRTASEAAAGEASQRRRPGRGPCRAGPRVQPQAQRQGGKTSRGNPLPTRLRRLWPDSGGGVSRAAPRRPSGPRNAAGLAGRRGPVEAPPPQVRTPASVAAPPQLPRRAGAMGHLRARLAGGTRREAAADRHDRRRQQRVAGALRAARLERGESPFAQDLSGTKRAARGLLHRPRQPVCQHAQKQRRRGPQALASHADWAGAPGAGTSNRSRPIRRRPKDASSAALAPPRTAW